MSTRLSELRDRIIAFRDERDWKQFHDLKNLAEAISIEAGELLELFLWKSTTEASDMSEAALDRIREEIADIFIFMIYFCHEARIDLLDAVSAKLSGNQAKYPAEKARGRSDKYSEL